MAKKTEGEQPVSLPRGLLREVEREIPEIERALSAGRLTQKAAVAYLVRQGLRSRGGRR